MKEPIEKFLYSKSLLLFLVLPVVYSSRVSSSCSIGENEVSSKYRKALWSITALIGFLLIMSRIVPTISKLWSATLLLVLIIIDATLVLLYCKEVELNLSTILDDHGMLKKGCDVDTFSFIILRMLNTACVVLAIFILAYMTSLGMESLVNKLSTNNAYEIA